MGPVGALTFVAEQPHAAVLAGGRVQLQPWLKSRRLRGNRSLRERPVHVHVDVVRIRENELHVAERVGRPRLATAR